MGGGLGGGDDLTFDEGDSASFVRQLGMLQRQALGTAPPQRR